MEFSVAGAPELTTRAMIGPDGSVDIPLLGFVKTLGEALPDLRTRVQQGLASKVFRRRDANGVEVPISVAPDEVSLRIAEYRPVYVNGDVSKPGSQSYRPGLTVQQAISLAGGYDIMHFRMNNPFLEQADLKGEYDRLWVDYARTDSELRRLNAELDKAANLKKGSSEQPIPRALAQAFDQLEFEQLATRNALQEKERDFLSGSVEKTTQRISILQEQFEKERAGNDADVAEMKRLQSLLDRGSTQITRVIDAKRNILLSSTRALQTSALAAQAERERDEYASKLAKLDDERRSGLLEKIKSVEAEQASITAQLRAVGDKLTYTSLVRSRLVSGVDDAPDIVIIRQGSAGSDNIEGHLQSVLAPGDVVEIALKKGIALPGDEGGKRAETP